VLNETTGIPRSSEGCCGWIAQDVPEILMTTTPYDHIADQFNAVRTRLALKEIEYLDLIVARLPRESKVLDLGCGTAHPIATHIASRGHWIVGIDASSAMLAFARTRLPEHRWIHDRIERVDFDETFNAVVCWDSLFHLQRQQFGPVIRKVHRWLAPGGLLMVSSGGVVDNYPEGFMDTMFGHEFFYDSLPPDQMVALIEEAGFDILLTEMCDPPDGGRNKGKWATIALRRG
jgi:SAM-dependent methyltransferase